MTQLLQERQSILLAGLALMVALAVPAWAAADEDQEEVAKKTAALEGDQGGVAEATAAVEDEADRRASAEAAAKAETAAAPVPLSDQPLSSYFGTNLPSAAPGYQGVEPGQEYTVDAANQTWKDEQGQKVKLPFDVPFVVKGKVEDSITSVTGRYVEFAKTPDCAELFGSKSYTVWDDPLEKLDKVKIRGIRKLKPGEPPPDPAQVLLQAKPIEKTLPVTGFVSGTGSNRFFRVGLLPLRPNRYYCFEFVLSGDLSAEQQKAVRKRFSVAIDMELRRDEYRSKDKIGETPAPVVNITSLDQFDALRRDLRLLLEDLVEDPQKIKVEDGSFFDTRIKYGNLGDRYKNEVEDILEQQEKAYHAFLNYESNTKAAVKDLLVARNARYGKDNLSILDMLEDPKAKARLDEVTSATGYDLLKIFGTYKEGELRGLARGMRTAEVDPWTGAFSVPQKSVLDARLDTLVKFSQAVNAVPDLVAEVVAGYTRGHDDNPDNEMLLPRVGDKRGVFSFDTDIAAVVNDLGSADTDIGVIAWLKKLQEFPMERARRLDKLVEALLVEATEVLTISGSTVADYNTRAIWYMSADLGFGLSSETEDFFTYVGWNIYLRPVNKKALLSWPGRPFTLREEFMRRFSFTLGVVQSGFEEEAGKIEGVIGNSAALIGAGFRINDSLRLSFGGMVFESQDPNPLISTTELNWSPYVALSVDWNASKTFARILP